MPKSFFILACMLSALILSYGNFPVCPYVCSQYFPPSNSTSISTSSIHPSVICTILRKCIPGKQSTNWRNEWLLEIFTCNKDLWGHGYDLSWFCATAQFPQTPKWNLKVGGDVQPNTSRLDSLINPFLWMHQEYRGNEYR